MRNYIRFVMRSRQGLYAYLRILLIVLGALFAVHMILLAVLAAAQYGGSFDSSFGTMLYELVGGGAGGLACAVMTDRMLRICVSEGVSRKSFLRGHRRMLPVFALATTAAIMLATMITDGAFHLFEIQFNTFAAQLSYISNQYQPRALAYNLVVVFCLELFFYTLGLLIIGFKERFSLLFGLIAVFLTASLCSIRVFPVGGSFTVFSLSFPLRYIGGLLECMDTWVDIEYITAYGLPNDINMRTDYFWPAVLILVACTVIWYLISYGVFFKLTAGAPVRGKKQEG